MLGPSIKVDHMTANFKLNLVLSHSSSSDFYWSTSLSSHYERGGDLLINRLCLNSKISQGIRIWYLPVTIHIVQ
jgi:hypothetical protein